MMDRHYYHAVLGDAVNDRKGEPSHDVLSVGCIHDGKRVRMLANRVKRNIHCLGKLQT